MHPTSIEEYMSNAIVENLEWSDLPEADWGAETFVEDVFDEDYQKHLSKLTTDFLHSADINPEDILTESMSKNTSKNSDNCNNMYSW